jgi:hypothetical protein
MKQRIGSVAAGDAPADIDYGGEIGHGIVDESPDAPAANDYFVPMCGSRRNATEIGAD